MPFSAKWIVTPLLVGLLLPFTGQSQTTKPYEPLSAGEIKVQLRQLESTGTALYLAAHPDDENEELITYLTHEMGVRTGYLSLNRGAGGQNLIGSEKWDELSVLRTQELMGARQVDGGHQFFTRTRDFGYSKSSKETMNKWQGKEVLSDVVWVYRKFRPQIIITRFPRKAYEGSHGHHTASANIAHKAFSMAGNNEKFSNQLDSVSAWQPKRVFFNTHPFFYEGDKKFDPNDFITVDVGKYNPMLGKSYTEIGGLAQSHHKSQGFGSLQRVGEQLQYFKHTGGSRAKNGLFDNIKKGWGRLKGGKKVKPHLRKVRQQFDEENPHKIITPLLKTRKAIRDHLEDEYWRTIKLSQTKNLIGAANGLWIRATTDKHYVSPGEEVEIKAQILRRGPVKFKLQQIRFPFGNGKDTVIRLPKNQKAIIDTTITIPADAEYTQPFWLRHEHDENMFTIPDQHLRAEPELPSPLRVRWAVRVKGQDLTYTTPVVHRWEDPVKGDQSRPVEIGPEVSLEVQDAVYVFSQPKARPVKVTVQSHIPNQSGQLRLNLPNGWKSNPPSHKLTFDEPNQPVTKTFQVLPPEKGSEGTLQAEFQSDKQTYHRSVRTIQYDHITTQTLFPKAEAKLTRVELSKKGTSIGYIPGSGDEIPASLQQMGYDVSEITAKNASDLDWNQFDAIVLGVRAYNTNKDLVSWHEKLMGYIKNGGTVVAQYSKSHNLLTQEIGPYPMKLSDNRITREEAKLKMLQSKHPIFNSPNKINQKDFKGWVQERGLYFAEKWNEQYTPLLSGHDPDEPSRKGALLVARYGDGAYIYTGLSFFRQLPAGNPGAYRLFANLVSYSPG